MSYAPDSILAVRKLIQKHTGLSNVALGIVGDDSHAQSGTSYHLGKDALRSGSYSVVESVRDSRPTNAAMALDVGKHSYRKHSFYDFNRWLVGECKEGAADTKDIREIIYTLDGRTVKRWDRLGKRNTGDSSHLTHTHISWFRDSEQRDKTSLFRRWYEHIGLEKPVTLPSRKTLISLDAYELPVLKYGEDDRKFSGNDMVIRVQRALGITADGIDGDDTAAALKK